ncbi:MAG: protease modulator HflC [Planctomycetes bacterium]|nr:protease modulator HflC [Planctomycetota bacterium]
MNGEHFHSDRTADHSHRGQPPGERSLRRFGRALMSLVLAGIVLSAVGSSVVFVDETQYVIVERLGHIVAVYDRPEDRGLHWKLPWPISTARRFDRRSQLFDPPGRELFTRDKKNITIDTYICWRIAPPTPEEAQSLTDRPVVRFFRALGTRDVAEARLDSRVRSILSTELGQVELSHLMSVTDSETGPDRPAPGLLEQLSRLVRQQVQKRPDEPASIRDRLGIEIVDVRIKRINFPLGNQQAVFERMKSERRKIADRYRSAGMAENMVIKSQADRQYNEILAKADADAERIRGEAEAEAIAILNKAHAQDPEFYRLMRTLDTYRKILNERTTLVLSASSALLKLLTEGIPKAAEEATPKQKGTGSQKDEVPSPDVTRTQPSQAGPEAEARVAAGSATTSPVKKETRP